MRNHSGGKNVIYVHMNYTHKYVLSYGIEFPEFMDSIPFKPANLLLLKHKFEDGYFNMHTLLHYASEDSIQQLMNDHVDRYGDFCWIDFTDEDDLNEMESQSLAELLYLSHMKAPLRPPFYRILGNQYAYLTQEDGFFNRTYYKHWEHFYGMLGGVLSTKVSPKRERSFLEDCGADPFLRSRWKCYKYILTLCVKGSLFPLKKSPLTGKEPLFRFG